MAEVAELVISTYQTKHSKLYDNVLPGDTVLADRGFNIKESVAMLYSKIVIATFTKKKRKKKKKNGSNCS